MYWLIVSIGGRCCYRRERVNGHLLICWDGLRLFQFLVRRRISVQPIVAARIGFFDNAISRASFIQIAAG